MRSSLRSFARVVVSSGFPLLSIACDNAGGHRDDDAATGPSSNGDGDGDTGGRTSEGAGGAAGDGDIDPNEVTCIVTTELRADIQVTGDIYMVNSYNSTGEPLTFEHHSSRDGPITGVESYLYNEAGLWHSYRMTNAEGLVLETESHSYDDQGRLERSEVDFDADGSPNNLTYFHYKEAGLLDRVELDRGADGAINYIQSYVYDEDGFLVSEHDDNEADGTIESSILFTNDSLGNPLITEYDDDSDGIADFRETKSFNEDGNVLTDTRSESDGSLNYWAVYTYREDGQLASAEVDYDGDDETDRLESYTYNDLGQLELREESRVGDLNSTYSTHYTYSEGCP